MNGSAHVQQETINEQGQCYNELTDIVKSHGKMICPVVLNIDLTWPYRAEVSLHPDAEDASTDDRVMC